MNEPIRVDIPENILIKDEDQLDMVLAFNNVTQDTLILKGMSRYLFLRVTAYKQITHEVLQEIHGEMSQKYSITAEGAVWGNEVIRFITGLHQQGFLYMECSE